MKIANSYILISTIATLSSLTSLKSPQNSHNQRGPHRLTLPPSHRISTGSQHVYLHLLLFTFGPIHQPCTSICGWCPPRCHISSENTHTEAMAASSLDPLWTGLLTPNPIYFKMVHPIPRPLTSMRMSTLPTQIFKSEPVLIAALNIVFQRYKTCFTSPLKSLRINKH